jgi:hypothetical protein
MYISDDVEFNVDFVGCVVWIELAKNCRPTPVQIRDEVDSSSAPDCSGFWRSSEIQTNTYKNSPPSGNYHTWQSPIWDAQESFSYRNSRNFPPFMKPEFHNRVQNSLKEVHVTRSKTTFLFNIICLYTGDTQGGLWRSGSPSKTFSLPCISHSQSFISLWRRGANCFI